MATPGGAGDAGSTLSSGSPTPRPHGALWVRGTARWVGGCASARGMQCPCHQGTGMHPATSLGCSSVWLSRAAAAGGLNVPPRHPMAPAASLPWLGVSQDPHVPLLFCSAGMEPPRGPRPAQPHHPLPAAAGPGRTLGCGSLPPSHPDTTEMGFPALLSASLQRGCCFPDLAQLPGVGGTGVPVSSQHQAAPSPPKDRHPSPTGFTSAPMSVPPGFRGFFWAKREDPLHFCIVNTASCQIKSIPFLPQVPPLWSPAAV